MEFNAANFKCENLKTHELNGNGYGIELWDGSMVILFTLKDTPPRSFRVPAEQLGNFLAVMTRVQTDDMESLFK